MFNIIKNQKGFNLIGALIGLSMALVIMSSALIALNVYTERKAAAEAIEAKEKERTELRNKVRDYMYHELDKSKYTKKLSGIDEDLELNAFLYHFAVIIPFEGLLYDIKLDFFSSWRSISSIRVFKPGSEELYVYPADLTPERLESYEQKVDEMLLCVLPDLEEELKILHEDKKKKEAEELKKKQATLETFDAGLDKIKCE